MTEVAPVKAILKALETGIKLAGRVSESAELAFSEAANSATTAKAQQIAQSAPSLQKALEQTCQAIRDAYQQDVEAYGKPFTKALVEDKTIQGRLKDLKNDVRDSIDECQDYEDDPESFERIAFINIQDQAQKCLNDCLSIFNDLRDQLPQDRYRAFMESQQDDTRAQSTEHSQNSPVASRQRFTAESQPKDDRALLSSMRQPSFANAEPPPYISPASLTEPLQINTPSISAPPTEPVKPKGPWGVESPMLYGDSPTLPSSLGTSVGSLRRKPVGVDVSHTAQSDAPPLIPKEIVHSRISANEEFLERRRQSRLMFNNELRFSAVSSIDENRASEVFSDGPLSPMCPSPGTSTSPVEGRSSFRASLNSNDMSRQRSQGHSSQSTRSSRTSSTIPDRQSYQRHDSEGSIFGLREAAGQASSGITENQAAGTSGNIELWSPIITTVSPAAIDNPYSWDPVPTRLQQPPPVWGSEAPSGLEPVNMAYDDGMIAVNAPEQPSAATFTISQMNYTIRPDSSFSKFGGFCEGAKALIRGETGFKIVKRPSGHYSATVSARCIACSYEVGWNDVEKDKLLDRAGIYGNSGIRFRQRFISKCHMKTNSIETPKYACLFCVEVHKTVEEHDATVFFSVAQLFKHLAKHPQPVPHVNGITVLYGAQAPNVLDFDLNFTSPQPLVPEYAYAAIAQKAATRPSAMAISSNHPKNNRTDSRDPDGNAVLHFALGARIVGITFPDRFNGQWAIGYHDGVRGAFPTACITIDPPGRDEEVMNSNSNLVAFAKWDFKLKKSKDDPWLKFNKGETIDHIGFKYQDQWCWTGQNAKGQWGIFPNSFVDNLHDRGLFNKGPASIKKGSLSSKIGLGRHRSSNKHERKTSMKSTSSGGSFTSMQPGLEVVQTPSPVHANASSPRFPFGN